ncbi:MAG: YceI family protein [Deltaproteobacteria bacterium]|nr:YceI family protein [Deltaproteobacteria bacterium]
MPTFSDAQIECFVFTFKEGVLSAVAHDLKIRVGRGSVTVSEDSVEATFDPSSLSVVCARKDGRDSPGTLSAGDKKKIEGNIAKDVLHTKKHSQIRFASKAITRDGDRATVTGDLTLHGQTKSITAIVTKAGDTWATEVSIHQPDFGIKPYTAMLGALKVQPTVKVQLSVPA